QVEKLDPSRIPPTTIEDSDSEDEDTPLAKVNPKTPPAAASPAKPAEITAPATVEQNEPDIMIEEIVPPPPPKLEPLKIKVDHRGGKESPPKRIQPPRGSKLDL